MKIFRITTLAAMGVLASACLAQSAGRVAICPFQFTDGNVTSRTMVMDTIAKILDHHGYTVLAQESVENGYRSMSPNWRIRHGVPGMADLGKYAASLNATHVVFGTASWHTRSIWVGTGPKTISTADIDLYVYNVSSNTIVYQRRGIEGRSDEKENALKDVADVLITPLITIVSGGPATPREQRAAQIAVARAIRPWIHRDGR
jgi:hypothetical protein